MEIEAGKNSYAPVVIFAYNRAREVRQCLDALTRAALARHTDVYVFSNAPIAGKAGDAGNVARVRAALRGYETCFHSYHVIEREQNDGANANMLDGISQVVKAHGRVIVLEDDIVVAYGFLRFMNRALDEYEKDPDIFSISGYNPIADRYHGTGDSFAYGAFRSWGWATWRDRWQNFDMQEATLSRIDLVTAHREAIMYSTCILQDIVHGGIHPARYLDYRLACKALADRKLTIYSVKSLCDNIGASGTGLTSGDQKLPNENFHPEERQESFALSRDRLTAQSDPYYFFRFRWDAFAMDDYFDINCERNLLYRNCYLALAEVYRHGKTLRPWFQRRGIRSIAIYGWGEAGKLLYDIAQREGLGVDYIVDRAKPQAPVPVYDAIAGMPPTGMVIVTALRDFFLIDEEFCYQTKLPVTSIDVIAAECCAQLQTK